MAEEQLNPKVLGQLLLMQSVLNNLPDDKSIFSFVCRGLLDIPGISKTTYSKTIIGKDALSPSYSTFPIKLGDSYFGEIIITLFDIDLYKPYEHYLSNFVFMIAVILEERKQRQLIEEHKLLLEQRIQERTHELDIEKENLAESQRRFIDLMVNVELLTVMLDVNGNISFCNNYLLHLTGYSIDEIMGRNWFDLFLLEHIIETDKKIFRGLMNGEEFDSHYENEILTKSGEKLFISWNNTILRDTNKQIIGAAVLGEDITQRKRNERLLKDKNDEIEAQNEEYLQLNDELNKTNQELIVIKTRVEESEKRFRSIVENTKAGYFFIDNNGLFQNVNKAWLDLYKYNDFDEVIGKHFTKVQQIDDLDDAKKFVDGIRKGDPAFMNGDFSRLCKDKSVGYHSFSARPVFINNTIVGIEGFIIDITKQKETEINLIKAKEIAERNEKKFRSMFNSMQEGVYLHEIVYDNKSIAKDYRIIEANPVSEKYLNIKKDHAIGKLATELFGTTEAPFLNIYAKVAETGEPISFEEYFQPMDKHFLISVFSPQKGEFATAFLDITKNKNYEKELLAAKEKAEESESKFRAIFENSKDAIGISKIGINVFFNKAYLSLFGYKDEKELIGNSILAQISPKEHNKIKDYILRRANTGEVPNFYETTGITGDAKEFPIEVTIGNYNLNNEVYTIAIIRDITERKKTENELITAKEHAEESDRLKTAFLQNMSHEIRTPMNAIMGFSDLMVKNFDNKIKLKKFSDIIGQRCNDLLDIINDILDIAKIESGQLNINFEEINLNGLFKELSTFFIEYQKRIGKEHIVFNLQSSFAPSENLILTDIIKLKQIFINLISNAFKYTNEGKIDWGCKLNKNNNLIFFVSDTGIGIPHDKHAFVFERFVQLRESSNINIGGTGLGLPIVKGLIGLLGGEIFLESEPNKGSTFSFTIPYKTAKPINNEPFVFEKFDDKILINKTILIVEDDFYNLEYLKEILSGIGLNILLAKNGGDSVEISKSHSIDLVLMDIRLPDISGFEATRQIKNDKPHLKIIAQTAYASPDEKKKALDAGCDDYLSKPTRQDVLMAMLYRHLK